MSVAHLVIQVMAVVLRATIQSNICFLGVLLHDLETGPLRHYLAEYERSGLVQGLLGFPNTTLTASIPAAGAGNTGVAEGHLSSGSSFLLGRWLDLGFGRTFFTSMTMEQADENNVPMEAGSQGLDPEELARLWMVRRASLFFGLLQVARGSFMTYQRPAIPFRSLCVASVVWGA